MKTSLLKGVEKDQVAELKQSFVSGLLFRKTLTTLLKDKIESNRVSSCSKKSYETKAWSEYQADSLGYERALREIVSLLSEEKL